MGLKDYKKFKKIKDFEEVLSYFGLKIEDVKAISTFNKRLSDVELKLENKPKKSTEKEPMTEDEKKAKAIAEGIVTPEQAVKSFAGGIEHLRN